MKFAGSLLPCDSSSRGFQNRNIEYHFNVTIFSPNSRGTSDKGLVAQTRYSSSSGNFRVELYSFAIFRFARFSENLPKIADGEKLAILTDEASVRSTRFSVFISWAVLSVSEKLSPMRGSASKVW